MKSLLICFVLLPIYCLLNIEKAWGGLVYYHPNHLGSSSVMTDSSGNTSGEFHYYPYGESFSETNAPLTQYRYTGQERDGETSLYYYGARYYDPGLARFISVDPVEHPSGPYSYVANNPLRFIDPSGAVLEPTISNATAEYLRFLQAQTGKEHGIASSERLLQGDALGIPRSLLKQGEWIIAHTHPGESLAFSAPDLIEMARLSDARGGMGIRQTLVAENGQLTIKVYAHSEGIYDVMLPDETIIRNIHSAGLYTLEDGTAVNVFEVRSGKQVVVHKGKVLPGQTLKRVGGKYILSSSAASRPWYRGMGTKLGMAAFIGFEGWLLKEGDYRGAAEGAAMVGLTAGAFLVNPVAGFGVMSFFLFNGIPDSCTECASQDSSQ